MLTFDGKWKMVLKKKINKMCVRNPAIGSPKLFVDFWFVLLIDFQYWLHWTGVVAPKVYQCLREIQQGQMR